MYLVLCGSVLLPADMHTHTHMFKLGVRSVLLQRSDRDNNENEFDLSHSTCDKQCSRQRAILAPARNICMRLIQFVRSLPTTASELVQPSVVIISSTKQSSTNRTIPRAQDPGKRPPHWQCAGRRRFEKESLASGQKNGHLKKSAYMHPRYS